MDFECLNGLPAETQLKVLLSALETVSTELFQARQILRAMPSPGALQYMQDHEHSSALIKDKIELLFQKTQT